MRSPSLDPREFIKAVLGLDHGTLLGAIDSERRLLDAGAQGLCPALECETIAKLVDYEAFLNDLQSFIWTGRRSARTSDEEYALYEELCESLARSGGASDWLRVVYRVQDKQPRQSWDERRRIDAYRELRIRSLLRRRGGTKVA